jgi:hypothetical protein
LNTAFAIGLVSAIDRTPRTAALRVVPLRRASSRARANHSLLWFAAPDRAFMAVSSGVGGSDEMAREIARSISFTLFARRLNQCVTVRP